MENLRFGRLQKSEQKISTPLTKLQSDSSDLRLIPTDIIIRHLEDNLKLREMSLTERLKKGMLK